uniref:Serine/arginine rich splicing factor n=1 Tax=Solanum tuberosum TaxID=4113 RepID=M1A744_SOLTU
MGRYRSRSRSLSRSCSPVRHKRHDEPRDRRRERRSPGPSGLLVRNIPLSAREPRGFGFVKFRYAEDAAEAKAHLNNTVIGGRDIRIVFAEDNRKTPKEMRKVLRTRCSIYVVCFKLQPC